MNIGIFAHEFPALSETFVLAHATGLMDLGHNVTILADRPRDETLAHDEIARYGLDKRTIYRTSPGHKISRAIGAAVRAGNRTMKEPNSVPSAMRAVRYRQSVGAIPLLDWWTRFPIPEFDIVHAHFGPMGQVATALRDMGLLQGKVVTTFHGVDVSAVLSTDPDMYRDLFRSGDAFLPVSEYWRTRLIEHGCPSERVRVHHMGIDAHEFEFRPRPTGTRGGPGKPLRILSVGRHVEKKGFAIALEAVCRFRNLGHDAIYTIIGDGPLRGHLERLAHILGIGPYVRFLGWRERRGVRQMMEQSDVLLAPSVTDGEGDQEGIPVTLMEAMASGLPVVSTLHSGIPELIEHGVSGLLVVERDVEGLAAALGELISHEGFAQRLADAARQTVLSNFDQRTQNRRLVELYENLLETPSPHAADIRRFKHRLAGRPRPSEALRS